MNPATSSARHAMHDERRAARKQEQLRVAVGRSDRGVAGSERHRAVKPSDVIDSRYRLERLLGTGGMAEVWLAEDERLGRWVAVKVLRDVLPGEQEGELVSGFQREARARRAAPASEHRARSTTPACTRAGTTS